MHIFSPSLQNVLRCIDLSVGKRPCDINFLAGFYTPNFTIDSAAARMFSGVSSLPDNRS